MNATCTIIEKETQNILVVRTITPAQDLPQFFGRAYGSVGQYMAELQVEPIDAPVAIYYNMDMQALDIAAGFVFASAQPAKGDVISDVIPAGKFAEVVHVGPYDTIEKGYTALTAFVEEKGLQPSGMAYEYYLNDPGSTPPEELQTRIAFALV